jgi:hypothetical protein
MGLLLHYHVPGRLTGEIEPGHLVIVPLRGQPTYGVVVELSDASPVEATQPILRLVDRRPMLPPAMLSLARWIASYYRCTLWQAIAPMLPPGVARRAITTVGLISDLEDPLVASLGRRQGQVVSLLKSTPKATLTLSGLKRKYSGPASGLISVLRDLENKGVVTRQTQLPAPRSRQQHERIIRLAVPADSASDALRDAAHNAPLQAATLDWLLKRIAATERHALNGNGHKNGHDTRTGQGALNHAPTPYGAEQPGDMTEEGWQLLRDLYLHTGATSSTVTALERKGLVEVSQRPIYRKPVPPTAATLNDEAPSLTSAQAAAWREISIALREGSVVSGQWSVVRDQGSDQIQNSKFKIQNSKNEAHSKVQNLTSKIGTVGAAACDFLGNLAAATSTGGMTNKKFGRVGDTPIIGAGNYADNQTCAVSCTGHGEFFMRTVAAYDVACRMKYKNSSLSESANEVVENLRGIGGEGGLIAVDAKGNVALPFNSEGMYRAFITSDGRSLVEIYK